jgi:hypothetical protein
MSQSRRQSLIEALVNVGLGYGLAVGLQLLLFPAFGLQATLAQNLKIGLWFTGLSILRSYALRRLFGRFHREPL